MSIGGSLVLPVSVVIPTRNRVDPLSRMLASLKAQGPLPAEIIIMDGSQGDATRELSAAYAGEVAPQGCQVTWKRAQALGAAVQRNQGIALARQPIVGFCDDDIVFETACLERLFEALDRDEMLGGVNAMITNQRYHPPGATSRVIFYLMAGSNEPSYAGRVLGPAVHLLPEDRDDLPEVVQVEWLNLGCTLYRRKALPDPPFADFFTGYSIMEDVTLSVNVGRKWKLANVRSARIFHDSQPGDYKADRVALERMELVNRHYVMTRVLGRRRLRDYVKLLIWESFQLGICALRTRAQREFWLAMKGKLHGLVDITARVQRRSVPG